MPINGGSTRKCKVWSYFFLLFFGGDLNQFINILILTLTLWFWSIIVILTVALGFWFTVFFIRFSPIYTVYLRALKTLSPGPLKPYGPREFIPTAPSWRLCHRENINRIKFQTIICLWIINFVYNILHNIRLFIWSFVYYINLKIHLQIPYILYMISLNLNKSLIRFIKIK